MTVTLYSAELVFKPLAEGVAEAEGIEEVTAYAARSFMDCE